MTQPSRDLGGGTEKKEIDLERETKREKKGVWVEGKGEKVRENEF